MKLDTLKSDFILLFVATIWGFAFVAQRIGMDHVGPFTFNGLRFVLGCLSLVPIVLLPRNRTAGKNNINLLKSGFISGVFLFCGISFQQVGLVYTTAGKAGFITGLYVVIVPILGLFIKQDKTSIATWVGAILAGIGMYLLSVTKDMTMGFGDLLVLFSAVCFAFHLIIIGRLSNRFNTARLSLVQCMVCAVLSLLVAVIFETFVLADILSVSIPLIYGGVLSVGVAYSLQIYGQKNSPASHAAIIFSLESVVAAIGGWIMLNELLSGRAIFGCALMLTGMLISQLYSKKHGQSL
ncbi:MAG: DMT family transporter [Proteobacteria bacterium]|nr:DMT family transporter [Pseudomonadota bacterium]MBU1586111.1 DMT family transporter [Pseudomonadota bacterium]MBU2454771.1 DMT family transporter [Pseudomonadota bacterium]